MFINGKISQYHILPLDSFSRLKLSNGNDTFDITAKKSFVHETVKFKRVLRCV